MALPRSAAGALQLTEDATGAAWVSGFLRRPTDGALVATQVVAGAAGRGGFLRAPSGALAYTPGAAAAGEHNGFALAADLSLATVAIDPAPPYLHHGLKFDTTGRVFAVVLV